MTPAYSVRLVEQLLDECPGPRVVFDPFSGTGTTALCADYRGDTGVATDINPFLVWLAQAKAGSYDTGAIESFTALGQVAAQSAASGAGALADCPPLRNIERWWRPPELIFLRRLKAVIDTCAVEAAATLLRLAFCRTMMKLSNAAFNHQSMSFRNAREPRDALACATQFLDDVAHIAAGAADNPTGSAEYLLANARDEAHAWRGRIDLLITSPPYPNRMSYIRELRPYMYWLDFLSTGHQAGELDWQAIGGTWGVATSRLADWSAAVPAAPDLQRVLLEIRSAHPRNGPLLANYVQKYFEDMLEHLGAMIVLLRPGATAHYIVGNSIFYGHEVRAQELLAGQMAAAGLRDVRIVPLRKRNSKQGLLEFQVSGRRRP